MTSSEADTSWGEGLNPTVIFKFDIWRSDVWKGNHDLTRSAPLQIWILAHVFSKPKRLQEEILRERTPADWDRGVEFEWLALGGTKIYNVQESRDGEIWFDCPPPREDIDFWWEALE